MIELQALAEGFELDGLYVFGSRAAEIAAFVRGEGQLDPACPSDVDVGVKPRPGRRLTARDRVQLMLALEDLWRVKRVDLVILPEATPFLAVDVVAGELLYARDADDMAEYELYILRRAGDLAPFERARRRQLLTGTLE